MRRLNKGQPIQVFTDCIGNNHLTNWEDFSSSHRDVSQEVRLHILCEEQDLLCGYTELLINDPYGCHIDHYRKKSLFPDQTFIWENFIVATMDDDFGARYKDLKYKIKATEYNQIINPVITDAQGYFYYPEYDPGNIRPNPELTSGQKLVAEKTIEIFNLTHPALNRRRETIIKLIESYGDLPPEDIRLCLKDSGFKSLVEQYTQAE